MELWIATGNKGKLEEYRLALRELASSIEQFKLFHQGEIKGFAPKPEDGQTFLDNARIKAKTLRAIKPHAWVLGEDSGLEVEGLNNLPGVHSARYAGPHARDSENIAKLLKMMTIRQVSPRTARFKCLTVVYSPEGEEFVFEGEMKGHIHQKAQGNMGFGYDPVFIPEGETLTLAELGPGYKIQKSHRAQALNKFVTELKNRLSLATN